MARERYLVGVSKEELEYKPPAPPPMTPKGKLQNIWYHYKWAIIGGVFAVIVLTVLIVQAVTREKPDYRICMATMGYLPDSVVEALEETLEQYGEDLNGDGEVMVSIQALNVSLEEGGNNQLSMANRQAVFAHIAARDVPIFAFDAEYYAELSANLDAGLSFFEPLDTAQPAVSEDGTSFSWDILSFAKERWPDVVSEDWDEVLPTDLVVGVRAIGDSLPESEETAHREAVELLQKYLAARPAD